MHQHIKPEISETTTKPTAERTMQKLSKIKIGGAGRVAQSQLCDITAGMGAPTHTKPAANWHWHTPKLCRTNAKEELMQAKQGWFEKFFENFCGVIFVFDAAFSGFSGRSNFETFGSGL